MCYSAQIWSDYRSYVRVFGADIDIRGYVELYWHRQQDGRTKIPKGMDAAFTAPSNDAERRIADLIATHDTAEIARIEQEIFAQRKRLADAERKLAVKVTKTASESKRIAESKVDTLLRRLADLKRTEPRDRDSRIFPGWYAPVMIRENGRRVIKPMRYQCRPHGRPALHDAKFPGTYNARRDNLEGFWRDLFGYSHGVMVADAFYENVSRHAMEGRDLASDEKEQNVVLEFRPNTETPMFVACLWSRWVGPQGDELLSFAAITDEPPAEISAAGHDRCIIPIRPENIDAWLQPDPTNLAAMYAILDDRERPYFEHRLATAA